MALAGNASVSNAINLINLTTSPALDLVVFWRFGPPFGPVSGGAAAESEVPGGATRLRSAREVFSEGMAKDMTG